MALSTVLVTPAQLALLQTAYPTIAAGVSARYKCAMRGEDVPELAWLEACVNEASPRHEVWMAVDGSTPCELAVLHLADARILWLVFNGAQTLHDYASTTSTLLAAISAAHGPLWGRVERGDTRTAIAASSPHVSDASGRMTWQ